MLHSLRDTHQIVIPIDSSKINENLLVASQGASLVTEVLIYQRNYQPI